MRMKHKIKMDLFVDHHNYADHANHANLLGLIAFLNLGLLLYASQN